MILHFCLFFHCPLGLGELQACPFPDVVCQTTTTSTMINGGIENSDFHSNDGDGDVDNEEIESWRKRIMTLF